MKKLLFILPILLGWGLWSQATDTRFGDRVQITQTVAGDLYIGAGNIEKVLTWIPFLGWIVSLLSVILAFGAVVLVIRAWLEEQRAERQAREEG